MLIKSFFFSMFSLTIAIFISGCSNSDGSSTPPSPGSPSPKVLINLGGDVVGLSGTVTVSNFDEILEIKDNGAFQLSDVASGDGYSVKILKQPDNQVCSILNADGLATSDIDDILIRCEDNKTWAGSVMYGGAGMDSVEGIAIAKSGRIYSTGYLTTGAYAYIQSRFPNGRKRWEWGIETSDTTVFWDIAVDSDENVYAVGYSDGTVDEEIATGRNDILVVKLSANGEKIWSRLIGGTEDDVALRLVLGSSPPVCQPEPIHCSYELT